jgi:exodeoxyribonuclease V beta subunit
MQELDLTKYQISLKNVSLIEASAGTGKTFSISNIVLQAILSEMPLAKILVVTFTDAATKELRSRIRENINEFAKFCRIAERNDQEKYEGPNKKTFDGIFKLFETEHNIEKIKLLEKALLDIDQAAIFTIHSFCQRMLTENAFESKIAYGAELITDDSEIIEEITENFWRKNMINISEEIKESYQDIKFDDILKLTRDFLKHPGIQIVNDTLPDTTKLAKELQEVNNQVDALLAPFDLDTLEEEMLSFFADFADKLKGSFSNAKLQATVHTAIESIKEFKKTGLVQLRYQRIVEKGLTAVAQKEEFILPEHEFFTLCEDFPSLVDERNAIEKEIESKTLSEKELIQLNLRKKIFKYVFEEFRKLKEKRHILTFDDLIIRLHLALKEEGKNGSLTRLINSKYELALVDEFQDTDNIQYDIFNLLFGQKDGKHGFFMIGDPKQSIYKFRGADIFSYLEAKGSAEAQYTLKNNYRSEAKMVNAINDLFTFKETQCAADGSEDIAEQSMFVYSEKDGAGISYKQVESKCQKPKLTIKSDHCSDESLQLWLVNGFNADFIEHNIATSIANEIVMLIGLSNTGKAYFGDPNKPLRLEDIAILVNTHKQAAKIKQVLAKSKIPAVIQNTSKIFESWEAREMQLWLKAVIDPVERKIRPLMITNLLKDDFKAIDEIDDTKMLKLTEELSLINRLWQKNGLINLFYSFMSKHNVVEKALRQMNGERIITNYSQLAELLHKNELRTGINIEQSLAYLEQQTAEKSTEDDFIEQLESDRNSVKIMTIHKAKGLEFPIVFCPFMWSNSISKGEKNQKIFLFNHKENGKYIKKVDFGADKAVQKENLLIARTETLAEYVRLLYVAVTRAGNRCYLSVGNDDKVGQSVLGYLFTDETIDMVGNSNSNGKANDRIRKVTEKTILGLKQFSENSQNVSLESKGWVKDQLILSDPQHAQITLSLPEKFSRQNLTKWEVSSFSGLTAKIPYKSDAGEVGDGVFSLPKGPNFGSSVHKIFENYFTHGREEFEKNKWKYFENPLKTEACFRKEKDNDKIVNDPAVAKLAIAEEMFYNTLNADIDVDGTCFKLANIANDDAKAEFSFYYTLSNISPAILKDIFAKYGVDHTNEFADKLESLGFSIRRGYMNGEIDLIFRYENKYYIVDWKTNHLGAMPDKYSPAEIKKNMLKHFYYLQAHIYSLALHLFLKQQLFEYSYDSHFGGFIYMYTRGVDDKGNGIFFNKPQKELIESLEHQLPLLSSSID